MLCQGATWCHIWISWRKRSQGHFGLFLQCSLLEIYFATRWSVFCRLFVKKPTCWRYLLKLAAQMWLLLLFWSGGGGWFHVPTINRQTFQRDIQIELFRCSIQYADWTAKTKPFKVTIPPALFANLIGYELPCKMIWKHGRLDAELLILFRWKSENCGTRISLFGMGFSSRVDAGGHAGDKRLVISSWFVNIYTLLLLGTNANNSPLPTNAPHITASSEAVHRLSRSVAAV